MNENLWYSLGTRIAIKRILLVIAFTTPNIDREREAYLSF